MSVSLSLSLHVAQLSTLSMTLTLSLSQTVRRSRDSSGTCYYLVSRIHAGFLQWYKRETRRDRTAGSLDTGRTVRGRTEVRAEALALRLMGTSAATA